MGKGVLLKNMRSFLWSPAAVLALATALAGCASSSGSSGEDVGPAEADLTSLPASGTFTRLDTPYDGSYVASIKLSADKHFEIDLVLSSTTRDQYSWFPQKTERHILQRGDTYNIFVDEGRRILAFDLTATDDEERTGVVVYELKAATSKSLTLAPVGTSDTFELRRTTANGHADP